MAPGSRGMRRHRITSSTYLGLIFVAVTIASLSIFVIHDSYPTKHDSVKDYLPTFAKRGDAAAVSLKADMNATNDNDSCFALNSKSWLQGPRLGNSPLESDEAAMDLILARNLSSLLGQAICHYNSRFRDWNNVIENDESSLNLAALRLIYLSFHIHQHEPAWKEARHRRQHCPTDQDLQQRQIGNMDYECRQSKFLVVPLGEAGLGAVMRLTVVNALLAGMTTRRVVLFVNNAHDVGPPNVRKPWPHASCPRHDMQCFFLASTPCVITKEELANAHVLERSEMRSMFRNGDISGEHAPDRVIVTKINTRPHMAPPHLRENLVAIAKKYILPNNNKKNAAVLKRAVELIHEIEPLEESRYYYFGHSSKVHHGAVFYAMRPRPEYAKLLNEIVEQNLPNENFDTATSFGLPIRGSDKCLAESECLSFEQYMNAIASLWNEYRVKNGAVANIIVTTEDENVMKDMHTYDSTSVSFPHRFITNKHDVLQGTGLANDFEKNSRNITADQVMLSSVSALKLQLYSKYTIGNCCSNFHNLLFDFVREGCGATRDPIATCLQEMEQAEFRVCCSWDKSDECVAKRQANT